MFKNFLETKIVKIILKSMKIMKSKIISMGYWYHNIKRINYFIKDRNH